MRPPPGARGRRVVAYGVGVYGVTLAAGASLPHPRLGPGLVHFGMDSRAGSPAAKPTAALIGGIIYVISSAYAHAQSA